MALEQQPTERVEVAGLERGRGLVHARVLGHHMSGARLVGHLLGRRVAQRASRAAPAIASHSARRRRVLASRERARHPAVRDDDREVGRDRHRA